MNERYAFKEELAQARAMTDDFRAGESEYAETKRELEDALQELRDFMTDWGMDRDWDHHGNITPFIEEGR